MHTCIHAHTYQPVENPLAKKDVELKRMLDWLAEFQPRYERVYVFVCMFVCTHEPATVCLRAVVCVCVCTYIYVDM